MPIYGDELSKWKNGARIFIESGLLEGYGASKALEAGYEETFSIEIDPESIKLAKHNFETKPEWIKLAKGKKINFILGDSSEKLFDVMSNINEQCCIFLDAHFGAVDRLNFNCLPLMLELEALKKHSIKTHTILIDDIRLLKNGEGHLPWTKEEIINKLLEINPNYKIVYAPGFQNDDIMIAFCKND